MKTITSFFAIVAISLASVSVFAQPTVAPTAPISRPVSSVISIYGTDTYTPITGVNAFPDWGQSGQGSTFTTYTIAGTSHNLLKYGKLSYQGIDFTGNAQDVSGMKYLHMDIWTADAAVSPLSVAIINGNSEIGNRVFIGSNCVINHGLKVADDVIVGSGSVIVKSILESGTYIGNPARRIK